ncbi:Dimeric alpha-beta barrel [Litoribrevibacter albus]|uniref:Dimeric alpha-beta barrel n=1 Tax=Litoribrevibacter albus TaxID=1473156 RepID=A0AA37W498_9GAMM|nr:Dimeric alpha-beta barrel [Litoribrevibacter albus]GLQ29967.1 hypothetical protein GCM10007876_04450 [Litoribrevibacter albus]
MDILKDIASCREVIKTTSGKRLALIYHLNIKDSVGYESWLKATMNGAGGKRLFRIKPDPVAREGMLLDEIVIDEFTSYKAAFDCLEHHCETLAQVCAECSILCVEPEPPVRFKIVRAISGIVRLFKGVNENRTPPARWKAENTAVWPDEQQMTVARAQNPDDPLYVYNLNKYKPMADYQGAAESAKPISGVEAYNRYAKIAGFELLRRGAYPVYGGKPICLISRQEDCMLADNWDHFVFVRYPQRRNLLAVIESDEFHQGEVHRDAGLERVAIFMAQHAE